MSTGTTSTYTFDGTQRNHDDAVAYCASLGSDTTLAMVNSQEEWEAIEAFMLQPGRNG